MKSRCVPGRPWRPSGPLLVGAVRPRWIPPRHHIALCPARRTLLTLAIETSCDDTCVAILEKTGPKATLLFNKKITSDNSAYGGIHPTVAVMSHTAVLAGLIQESLPFLPAPKAHAGNGSGPTKTLSVPEVGLRQKPDFISVTRGPGLMPALSAGLNTAKGLAVAWGVPLLGVNHMQAHALTPRLVSAVAQNGDPPAKPSPSPSFPFLSLLVSGGHTILLSSLALTSHRILAQTPNIAIGDLLDKAARAILPPSPASSPSPLPTGALLERFAFAPWDAYGYEPPLHRRDEIRPYTSPTAAAWTLPAPLAASRAMAYDFSGLNGAVAAIAAALPPGDVSARRELARAVLRVAFEHLASRVVFALRDQGEPRGGGGGVQTLVLSGGVASNAFLRKVLRAVLDVRGFGAVEIVAPPAELCTDNAAMIAWAGVEMYEAGWRTGLAVLARRKWSLDPAEDGGILGVDGWLREEGVDAP